ncbi:MAG: M23 family metallopeptidase [Deltaproteobacteria bacterium]|nr:M23 family metallopeptidase [Deltaproteobacteria bacterium]
MGELTFKEPVHGSFNITSVFDEARPGGRKHKGIDYGAPKGTPVEASESGDVIASEANVPGYGDHVIIDHAPKAKDNERHIYTLYAHLNTIGAGVGDIVKKGKTIGTVGHSGYAYSKTGKDPSHLHFEVIDCPWKASRADILSKEGKAHAYRKDPKGYLDVPTAIEGTIYDLTEEEKNKIVQKMEVEPHIDFEHGTWRMDVVLGGKKVGHIDKHNKEIKLSLSPEEVEEILRQSTVS